MRVPGTIAIELEAAGDSRSTFRLRVDSTVVGGNLTAAQAQLLVADILERIALPNRDRIGREIGAAEGELEPRGHVGFQGSIFTRDTPECRVLLFDHKQLGRFQAPRHPKKSLRPRGCDVKKRLLLL